MKNYLTPLAAVGMLGILGACKPATQQPAPPPESGTQTIETRRLQAQIEDYRVSPTAEKKAEVDKAFAELDSEIAELEARVTRGGDTAEASRKLADLRAYRDAQRARFLGEKGENAVERAAGKVGEALRETGEAIQGAGESIKDNAPPENRPL